MKLTCLWFFLFQPLPKFVPSVKETHEVILRQQKNLPSAFRQVLVTFTGYFSVLVLF